MNYEETREFLKQKGYILDEHKTDSISKVRFSIGKCKGVKIAFGELPPKNMGGEHGTLHYNIAGKIAADNAKCFDKWSTVPLVLEFPNGENQANELISMLEHLATKEALAEVSGYLGPRGEGTRYTYKKRR